MQKLQEDKFEEFRFSWHSKHVARLITLEFYFIREKGLFFICEYDEVMIDLQTDWASICVEDGCRRDVNGSPMQEDLSSCRIEYHNYVDSLKPKTIYTATMTNNVAYMVQV